MRVKSTVSERGVGRRTWGGSCHSGRFLQTMLRNSVFVLETKCGKRFSRGGSGLSCCGAVTLEAGRELGAVVAIWARDHGPWPKLLEVVRETMGDRETMGRPAGVPWSGSWSPRLGCLCSLPAFTLPSLLPLSPTVPLCHLLSASGL